eukprot:10999268-Prorocentrum_lima.AAC.1
MCARLWTGVAPRPPIWHGAEVPMLLKRGACGPSPCSVAWTICGTSRSWTAPWSWGARRTSPWGLCRGG